MVQAHSKRQKSIKSKLMAAICMLLVSSIMMVSSTYAWFTLSTAPEVTGIQTAVGANGNLEMALLPATGGADAITSDAGDSILDVGARNITWGNLVELADTNVYGMDQIKLFPSRLNLTDAGGVNAAAPLKTPSYGADGRVSQLLANTVTGVYDSQTKSFSPSEYNGVRAVGTASGMTDRQLDYRNARADANTATAQAKTFASQSLNNNGSALANIAIKRGTSGTDAKFTQADIASLKNIVNDLLGTTGADAKTGVLQYIETAYMKYILAFAASNATNTKSGDTVTVVDTAWQAAKGAVEKDGATLDSVLTAMEGKVEMPTDFSTAVAKFQQTVSDVKEAQTKLNALTGETITWTELSPVLNLLANPDEMEVNAIKASEIMQDNNMSALVNSVAAGGLKVTMTTGGGVYADIADQCGDFTASVTINEVTYGGLTLNNMSARMETKSSVTPPYLSSISTVVQDADAPVSGTDNTMPISDFYGYIIDLGFRTNAAESSLKLQVEGIDRIYGEDNTNENTQGGGSSMTFAATTTDFDNDQVKALMNAIRIVFFNPDGGNVYAYAKLDTANAQITGEGIVADMYLYDVKGVVTYEKATYNSAAVGVTYFTKETVPEYKVVADVTNFKGTLYTNTAGTELVGEPVTDGSVTYYEKVMSDKYTEAADPSNAAELYIEVESATNKTETPKTGENKDVIMPLTQNEAHELSVLVYLDGDKVTNGDVAATAATSMTGSMNLQFSSTATLVPMEYAALHISDKDTYTVTKEAPDGVTISGEAKAIQNTAYNFTLLGTDTDANTYAVTYKIGEGTANPIEAVEGTYTIPADKVTGNVTITVTATPKG